eukprot:m.101027 g.101027  ORF g.101027 m.101027 type:complete len:173 (-) comp16788_c0_seq1:154-672(-)
MDTIDGDELFPIENFALVTPGIYRSGFPERKNISFMDKLKLKSVISLVPESMPEWLDDYYKAHDITLFHQGIPGNKEPFVDIPEEKIVEALGTLLDSRNHPILIHCNKGKHRTGCLVGCLRKLQYWSLVAICDEYRRFADPKSRVLDQQFIELFDVTNVSYDVRYKPHWLLN